jgi:hypothetical protein
LTVADIVRFPGMSTVPMAPAESLELAKGWDLERVVIVGMTNGGEFKFGGSHCDVPMINLLLDIAKKRMMETADP